MLERYVVSLLYLDEFINCCHDNSQAYVRHPELAAARANRDYVLKEVSDAVSTISGVAQATGQSEARAYEGSGELAAALDEFDVCCCYP